ncbi:hypothetical protein BIY29_05570 [Brenneria alni]|uniref:Uncharacterized protein n=1 Tax=Brenneria alni TaxID=71656 RepID=A0A421DR97_9GAMM|nr:hypothetical protein [Brenneria alni]RLM26525.1 hypothetical protein BIY29_05570 [Brenneria alni]
MNQTQSVDLISSIVGEKLGVAGDETRRLAITGALSGTVTAFYSRQQSFLETVKAAQHDGIHQTS